jgi:hypothetical protein
MCSLKWENVNAEENLTGVQSEPTKEENPVWVKKPHKRRWICRKKRLARLPTIIAISA